MKNIAVLVSKNLHCLQRLIGDVQQGQIPARIACVLSNHVDLEPVAREAGIAFEHTAADDTGQRHFEWLLGALRQHSVDLVVLARYMRILPPAVVAAFGGRIINIHPGLTPAYPGPRPYQQAFDSGVRVAGCTAHFVTEQLDEGPIIAQDVFRIDVGRDTLNDVKQKGMDLEAQTLSSAVRLVAQDAARVAGNKVIIGHGA